MYFLLSFIHVAFTVYTLLIAARIISSWFPSAARHPVFLFIGRLTDPFLHFFRRIIPPIGGTFDLSPILAFISLRFLEMITNKFILWVAYTGHFF